MRADLTLHRRWADPPMATRELEGDLADVKAFLAEALDRMAAGQAEGEEREIYVGIKLVG